MIDTTYLQSLKDKIKQPLTDYFSQLKSGINEQIKPREPIPQNGDENEIINKIKEHLLTALIGKIYQSIQQRSFEPIKQELTKKIDITNPEELAKIRERTMMMTIGMTEPLAKVKTFQGLKGLSTKLLEKFKGMPDEITPQQFNEIINKATKEGIRKADLDLIKEMAERQQRELTTIVKKAKELMSNEIGESNLVFIKANKTNKNFVNQWTTKTEEDAIESAYLYLKENPSKGIARVNRKDYSLLELEELLKVKRQISNKINLTKLAKDVETQLVPLTPTPVKSPRWSHIGEEFIGDGKYEEIVYQSPYKTWGGEEHYSSRLANWDRSMTEEFPNMFGHIRREILPDGKGIKIVEIQADPFQRPPGQGVGSSPIERQILQLESELDRKLYPSKSEKLRESIQKELDKVKKQATYISGDPLSHLRIIREQIQQAAKEGKEYILIPSGDTAMKIEGLGDTTNWTIKSPTGGFGERLKPEKLKIGIEIEQNNMDEFWIITDIFGEGKFKAMQKSVYENFQKAKKLANGKLALSEIERNYAGLSETFDISGKVDTQHFVYKLNEEAIPKEARKMGLEVEKVRITNKGKIVPIGTKTIESNKPGEWWRIKIPKERAKFPVEAFGVFPFIPQFIKDDKNDN